MVYMLQTEGWHSAAQPGTDDSATTAHAIGCSSNGVFHQFLCHLSHPLFVLVKELSADVSRYPRVSVVIACVVVKGWKGVHCHHLR